MGKSPSTRVTRQEQPRPRQAEDFLSPGGRRAPYSGVSIALGTVSIPSPPSGNSGCREIQDQDSDGRYSANQIIIIERTTSSGRTGTLHF